ncbi:MAG TPA: hypothetical protein VN842_05755 [Thermoplasmata archaeon]|nr:hypothetical protein [Thermoplasmata archaeon]
MPESVSDLVEYSGLSARQLRLVRFLEKDPTHGFTAAEIAAGTHAGLPFVRVIQIGHDLESLVSQGRIRSIILEGHRNYFLR